MEKKMVGKRRKRSKKKRRETGEMNRIYSNMYMYSCNLGTHRL